MDESNANVESHEPLDRSLTHSSSTMESGFLVRSLSQFRWISGFGMTTILILVGLFWSIVTFSGQHPHVTSGDSILYYSQGISKSEAQQLLDSQAKGIMKGVLRLDRVDGRYQVTWWVKNDPGSRKETLELAARDGWRISSQVFSLAPVQVRVVSETGEELGVERCFITGSKKRCQSSICLLHSEAVTIADVDRLLKKMSDSVPAASSGNFRNAPFYLDYRNQEYTLQVITFNADFNQEISGAALNDLELTAGELSEECFFGARVSIQICDAQLRPHRVVVKQKSRKQR